jgi:MFS family permease
MLSPGFLVIAASLNISVPVLGQSTAWLILCIGLSLFLANPLAKKIGRRPVFIVAVCIMFACSIWGAFSKNYNSFLASRIIAGVGMAPYEVLVQNTIGDLYFVHQRATRIAAWNLFLLCGISGGSLISGTSKIALLLLHLRNRSPREPLENYARAAKPICSKKTTFQPILFPPRLLKSL